MFGGEKQLLKKEFDKQKCSLLKKTRKTLWTKDIELTKKNPTETNHYI